MKARSTLQHEECGQVDHTARGEAEYHRHDAPTYVLTMVAFIVVNILNLLVRVICSCKNYDTNWILVPHPRSFVRMCWYM